MWRRFGRYFDRWEARGRAGQGEVFAAVEQRLRNDVGIPRRRWRRHTDFSFLRPLIDTARQRALYAAGASEPLRTAEAWLETLVLQAPEAALAQNQMDKHKHGYHNRAARVMELIDFNDAYVQAVLALPPEQRHNFDADLKAAIDWFCKRVGGWTFSHEQFEAITHGLSREIAVYNAVKAAGLDAQMTDRAEDAFGIDMHITDRTTGKRIHVDTKTNSAFHYRLIELMKEGRLSQADADLAEQQGYTAVMNGHGGERMRIILWRVDHGTLGTISDFAFEHSGRLVAELGAIMQEYGEAEN